MAMPEIGNGGGADILLDGSQQLVRSEVQEGTKVVDEDFRRISIKMRTKGVLLERGDMRGLPWQKQ